jgi:hypothetical protein
MQESGVKLTGDDWDAVLRSRLKAAHYEAGLLVVRPIPTLADIDKAIALLQSAREWAVTR